MLGPFSFCSNQTMNSAHKLGWGVVGNWHFNASFGQSRGFNVFFFFLVVLSLCFVFLFFSAHRLSLVAARSDFLVTCVQVSHAIATLVAEHRLSTCVARA